MVFLLISNIIS